MDEPCLKQDLFCEVAFKSEVNKPKIALSHLNGVSRWKRKRCQEKPKLWDLYVSILEAKSYAIASASDGAKTNQIEQELAKHWISLHVTSLLVEFSSSSAPVVNISPSALHRQFK